MKKAELNNGIKMPYIGLGVFRLDDEKLAENAINNAFSVGYRHIDTAAIYGNEEAVGNAIRKSGLPREDIFVTTKLWNENMRLGNEMAAFDESLKKLQLDYVDLYLIHWPVKERFVQAWKVLEGIYKTGKAKAIGVSNFKEHHLDTLMENAEITPAVNQIELHPYLTQQPLLDYCSKLHICVESWSPFTAGKTALLKEKVLVDLGEKYNKTSAQIILRWNYQRQVVVIPKSSNIDRMKQNLDIFDFELSEDDMNRINSLNKNLRVGADPDDFNF